MDLFEIQGGRRLRGEVAISGAKNAALPIMASCLLAEGPSRIRGIPDLADVNHLIGLLVELGMDIRREPDAMVLEVVDESNSHARYDLVRKMRASVCVLGPLLAKRGQARVAMPGGCAIGPRPIDIHLRGLEALGGQIGLSEGDVVARAKRLRGAEIFLGGAFGSSVTATANVMMAAVLAEGSTLIESAACEPEIQDLADFLNAMGARIVGAGSPRVVIEGVDRLTGAEHTVIPDRIEAATLLLAVAITRGTATVTGVVPEHLSSVLAMLRRAGSKIETGEDYVTLEAGGPLLPIDLTAQPYPGVPTDVQAQFTALACLAGGRSTVRDDVFPHRFMHVAELLRMGANIRKEGPTVIVTGVKRLIGAPVMATDLRASVSLVLAGLAAEGETIVNRVYHLDRGYDHFEKKLQQLGANVYRISK